MQELTHEQKQTLINRLIPYKDRIKDQLNGYDLELIGYFHVSMNTALLKMYAQERTLPNLYQQDDTKTYQLFRNNVVQQLRARMATFGDHIKNKQVISFQKETLTMQPSFKEFHDEFQKAVLLNEQLKQQNMLNEQSKQQSKGPIKKIKVTKVENLKSLQQIEKMPLEEFEQYLTRIKELEDRKLIDLNVLFAECKNNDDIRNKKQDQLKKLYDEHQNLKKGVADAEEYKKSKTSAQSRAPHPVMYNQSTESVHPSIITHSQQSEISNSSGKINNLSNQMHGYSQPAQNEIVVPEANRKAIGSTAFTENCYMPHIGVTTLSGSGIASLNTNSQQPYPSHLQGKGFQGAQGVYGVQEIQGAQGIQGIHGVQVAQAKSDSLPKSQGKLS